MSSRPGRTHVRLPSPSPDGEFARDARPAGSPLTEGTPARLVRLVHAIEGDRRLDRPAGVLAAASSPLDGSVADDLLRGAWLGHALHPLLTDFPLGTWTSATLLDLFGGARSRPAAQGLVAFGVAMTLPTIASGVADWRRTPRRERRVGVVHGLTNALAAACYAASMAPRARGRRARAASWSVAGGLAATFSGYLGGHLSIARHAGGYDAAFADGGTP